MLVGSAWNLPSERCIVQGCSTSRLLQYKGKRCRRMGSKPCCTDAGHGQHVQTPMRAHNETSALIKAHICPVHHACMCMTWRFAAATTSNQSVCQSVLECSSKDHTAAGAWHQVKNVTLPLAAAPRARLTRLGCSQLRLPCLHPPCDSSPRQGPPPAPLQSVYTKRAS